LLSLHEKVGVAVVSAFRMTFISYNRLRQEASTSNSTGTMDEENNVGSCEAIEHRNGISHNEVMKGCYLSEEQLLVLQQCKEEQISDDEFPSSGGEVNEEKTWYPSECVLEEWNHRRERSNDSKETSKQDLSVNVFNTFCKEEQLSDEDFIARNSAEEQADKTWYPSEIELETLKEGEEAKGIGATCRYCKIFARWTSFLNMRGSVSQKWKGKDTTA